MLLADIFFAQNKNDKGLEVQQFLADKFPTDLNIQISLLSTLLYLERYEESLMIFDHLEKVSGFNNELSLQKQRVYMEMGNPEMALDEAERLVSYFPHEPLYLELLAELYRENDRPEKAVEVYRMMLEEDPENAMARLLLADFYRNLGETEKSFVELVKAFESPQLGVDGKVRILVSYYFLSEEDNTYLDQAWQLCEILVETHPDEAKAHALYGDFLVREKKNERARERYETAVKLDPAELSYWEQLLSLQIRLNDHEGLLASSGEALEYFFEQPLLYFFHGLGNYYLERYESAIKAFNDGLELAFDNPELMSQFHTLLGDTYFKTGDYNKSYYNYEQALEINPDDAYALNNYSYYLSKRNEDLDKALTMSARSLEIQPDNASFQDTYGWIKYKLGDYQQARIWIKKSLDNSEESNAVVLEHYGDVLYKLGEKEQALVYWKKALEADREGSDVDGVSEFLEKKIKEGTLFE
jgi:tetratricopeptide (TPR) repeat protein